MDRFLIIVAMHAVAVVATAAAQDGQSFTTVDSSTMNALKLAMRDFVLTRAERLELIQAGVPKSIVDDATFRMRERPMSAPAESGPLIQVPVRSPMTYGELVHVLRILRTSDAQRAFIEGAFAAYHDRAGEWWIVHTPPLWAEAHEASAAGVGTATQAALLGHAFKFAMRLDDDVRAMDDAFLEELRSVLAESQWADLDRAKLLRKRMACRLDDSWHPGAKVDLSQLFIELQNLTPGTDLSAPKFAEILSEYERRLTALAVKLHRQSVDAEMQRASNLAQCRAFSHDQATLQSLKLMRRESFAIPIRTARSIHELNLATLPGLMELLPLEVAQLLQAKFLQLAYPLAYPIDRRALDCLDRAIADPTSSDAALATLSTVRGQLDLSLGEAAHQIAVRSTEWKVETAEVGGYQNDRYRAYQAELLQMLERQHEANCRAIDMIQLLAPARRDDAEQVREALDEQFAHRSNPSSGRGFGWPDPYGDFDVSTSH